LIFFALTVLGLRQWLARLIPRSIALAIGAGIGLFLTLIGLSSSGLNVVQGASSTPLSISGCPAQYINPDTGICDSHLLQDPRMWVGIFAGGIVTAFLLLYRVKGALLWPIFIVAIISWPRSTNVTTFPHTEIGDSNFDFFKNVVSARGFKLLGPKNVDWAGYKNGKVWIALVNQDISLAPSIPTDPHIVFRSRSFTSTFWTPPVLWLPCLSKPVSLTREMGTLRVVLLPSWWIPHVLPCPACSSDLLLALPSLVSLSTGTHREQDTDLSSWCLKESASGIGEGGKTGLTAIATSFWFFISIFFAPILSNIPSWATGSVLIVVGAMMMENATKVNWDFIGDALPAFIVLSCIPFTCTYHLPY
jgi:AGZA family xanthine/uracil permease-like MFS transporter